MKDPVRPGSPDGDPQPLPLSSVSTVPSKAYGSDAACLVRPDTGSIAKGSMWIIFLLYIGCHRCEGYFPHV